MLALCVACVLAAAAPSVAPARPVVALDEGAGILLTVPDGWVARRVESMVILSSTRAGAAIVIDVETAAPAEDAAALRQRLARAVERRTGAPGFGVGIGSDAVALSWMTTAGGERMRMRTVARRVDATHVVLLRGAGRADEVGASFDDVVDHLAASIVVAAPTAPTPPDVSRPAAPRRPLTAVGPAP